MTTMMKNLGTLVASTQQQQPELTRLLARLKGKPFYCGKPMGNSHRVNYCCQWHCFPPKKADGSYSELYPFQASLVEIYKSIRG